MLAPLPTAHPRVSPEQLQARGYFLREQTLGPCPGRTHSTSGSSGRLVLVLEFSRSLSAASDWVLWPWSLPITVRPDAVL